MARSAHRLQLRAVKIAFVDSGIGLLAAAAAVRRARPDADLVLSSDPEVQVVGEARDGAEAVALTRKLRPDVVTMDIQMPRMNGFEATKEIMITAPTPIVIVTGTAAPGVTPCGTTTFTWYSPGNPGARPLKTTCACCPPMRTIGACCVRERIVDDAGDPDAG